MINTKNYDMALCNMTLSPSPNLSTFFGENNMANYSSDEITNDDNVLKEKYQRLMEIYKTDIPYISLYTNKYIVAYNSSLVGDITPNWFNLFYGVEGWYK